MNIPTLVPCSQLRVQDPIFDALRQHYTRFDTWLAAVSAQNRQALVIHDGPNLAALAILKPEQDPPAGTPTPAVKICTFAVAPSHRGRGLGRTLLRAVSEHARRANAASLYLTAAAGSWPLDRLLRQEGFTAGAAADGEVVYTRTLAPVPGRTVLMSIHPRYANALLDGTKKVELRTRPLAGDVDTVVVYATAPVQAVAGQFTVLGQDVDTPEQIWDRHHHHAAIDEHAYTRYFAGRTRAVAIIAGDAYAYPQRQPLSQLGGLTRPPQSYLYLPSSKAR